MHGGGGQAREVWVVLHGAAASAREFVQRLRTQNVDVDRSGRPCKERQATVLQPATPLTTGQRVLEGWHVEECATDAQISAGMAELGIRIRERT